MARRRRHEEHEHHEAWAIPYGDLVTLLLAFFVVMYSISSVNEGKYRVVSDSLNEAFHGSPRADEPINVGEAQQPPQEPQLPLTQVNRLIAAGLPPQRLQYPGHAGSALLVSAHPQTVPPADATPGAPAAALLPTVTQASVNSVSGAAVPPASANVSATPVDVNAQHELDHVAADVNVALQSLIASGQVHVRRYADWVAVDISTDILFQSGAARLAPAAVSALQRLAAALGSWPNNVRVEGHTDDRPITTTAFPSNWELSAARAASVVRLFMDQGIAPARLAVLGFGQYRPLMPNATPAGRNANRRVEVVILGVDAAPEVGL